MLLKDCHNFDWIYSLVSCKRKSNKFEKYINNRFTIIARNKKVSASKCHSLQHACSESTAVIRRFAMALVLRTIYNSYHYYFYTTKGQKFTCKWLETLTNLLADPRSEGWFLVQTPPLAITSILIGYVILIKHGPKLMEKREPFELKYIMMLYNLFQVVSNFILGVYVSRCCLPLE